MLYHLLYETLSPNYSVLNVFRYQTFRAMASFLFAFVVVLFIQPRFIRWLQSRGVKGQPIRELGPKDHEIKRGTPTMGGVIILTCLLIPVLLFARLDNVYVILLIVSAIWMGAIGYLDDYIKVFRKNKEGLAGKFKIVGQVGLGLIVGLTLYFHPDVVVRAMN